VVHDDTRPLEYGSIEASSDRFNPVAIDAMPVHRLAEMTWEEVRDADRARAVAILPVGAVEAHGPHLPLGTDVIIAEAMARRGGEKLSDAGFTALVMPPLWYTAAGFARNFPGTIGVDGDTVRRLIREIATALAEHGIKTLAIANAHLDPENLAALRAASGEAHEGVNVVFVDLTRRAVAEQLTDEFRTGACHAGRFEGSVVMAEAPDLVKTVVAAELEPNPSSLSDAIRDGARTFADAGGPRAYFGWPADATTEEGRETIEVLAGLLADAVIASVETSA
jgi:creatinine amidohydrolase